MVCGVCPRVSTITEGECRFLTLHVGHTLQFICTVVYTGLFFKTSDCHVIEHATCFCIAVVVQTCPTFIFSVSIFLWLLLQCASILWKTPLPLVAATWRAMSAVQYLKKKTLIFSATWRHYVEVTDLIVLTFRVKLSFTVSFHCSVLKCCLYFHTLKSLYTFSDFTEQIKACFLITVHHFYSSFSHSIIPVGFFPYALQWLM